MSQNTLLSLALLGLALLIQPAHAQGSDPAQQTASAEEPIAVVSLLDVAELEFQPDPERMEDWDAWPSSWAHDFFLVVDESGAPTHCEPFDLSKQSELADRLCSDLMSNARAAILNGFTMGGRQGIMLLNKQPYVSLPGIGPDATKNVPLFSVELAPEAFTDYAPMTAAEAVRVPGIEAIEPDVLPTYPRGAVGDRHEGSSGVLLSISSEGEVVTCRPLETSGFARLDNASCVYALEHLRFNVSNVPEDHVAPYYYGQRITWRIRD